MIQERNIGVAPSAPAGDPGGARGGALSARSVVASVLLGTTPPRLPVRALVRTAELFGIAEGTTRVAISRMVSAGELVARSEMTYELAGHLLGRLERQEAGRHPLLRAWDSQWLLATVNPGRRSPEERAALRDGAGQMRMALLREGVWLRPDNLDQPVAEAVKAQCLVSVARPDEDPTALASRLWDLSDWSARGDRLLAAMHTNRVNLDSGSAGCLPDAFVLAAAVVRHLATDPLLPPELLGPDWPGQAVRQAYDAYEKSFQSVLQGWLAGS
ncbi:MAG: PaaX family transcriptional regulator C-terminal domain-containing protein [Acidimicrobiales bacterium]